MIMNQLRKLRQLVPVETEYEFRNACASLVPIRRRSRYSAIFHACVWKTASQWIRVVLSDPRIYMYCGLKTHIPISSDIWWSEPHLLTVPDRRIVPDLYCGYDHFLSIAKPKPYAVFFVQRDPRDIVISWYFSNRFSHRPTATVNHHRQALVHISERDGILATLDCFEEISAMLRSWREAASADPAIRIVRYEDLTGADAVDVWSEVLAHCDILVPQDLLRRVLDTYSFERISGGRRPGEEDKSHKYRKGIAGDWKNHFDDEISRRFYALYGNLAEELGYA